MLQFPFGLCYQNTLSRPSQRALIHRLIHWWTITASSSEDTCFYRTLHIMFFLCYHFVFELSEQVHKHNQETATHRSEAFNVRRWWLQADVFSTLSQSRYPTMKKGCINQHTRHYLAAINSRLVPNLQIKTGNHIGYVTEPLLKTWRGDGFNGSHTTVLGIFRTTQKSKSTVWNNLFPSYYNKEMEYFRHRFLNFWEKKSQGPLTSFTFVTNSWNRCIKVWSLKKMNAKHDFKL